MTYRFSRRWRRSSAVILAGLLALAMIAGVSAHESREVGDYQFVVGFTNEPAYVNELNGIDLRISRADDGEPVESAHETLDAAVHFGEETREVELRSVFGEPGSYTADIIPTATGSYSFQFVGEIDGQEVDEVFRGGPDTFSEIEERAELEFPAGAAESTGESDQAMAIGIAGVAAGLFGLIAGAAGYYKATQVERGGGGASAARQRVQNRQEANE